jgi:hypothetical protein
VIDADRSTFGDERRAYGPQQRFSACLLLASTLLLGAVPAASEVVELDLYAAGDGLLSWDTETNLQWLDLTATTNTSWAEIDGDHGGWLSAGFRRASGEEICTLFRNIGFVSEPCPVVFPGLDVPLRFPADGGAVARHLELLGVTWFWPTTYVDRIYAIGFFDDGSPSTSLYGYATVERQVYRNVEIDRARADVWTDVYSRIVDQDFKIDRIGHYLVRAGPTDCNNGEDDDGDGWIDGDDPGCDDGFDNSENSTAFACDDGIDNDGDGLVDVAMDPGCARPDEPFEDSEDPDVQHVLILHTGSSPPVEPLLATGRFTTVTDLRIDIGTLPEEGVVLDHDAVLAYTSAAFPDPEAVGDLLADFADTGGRVVVATYALSSPWAIGGRIAEPGYSPLVNAGVNGAVSGAIIPVDPNHGVFANVNLAAVRFAHNENYAHAELDPGATLLANDGQGHYMLAQSVSGRVIALNAIPVNASADFYNLLANTLLPIPDPLGAIVSPFQPGSGEPPHRGRFFRLAVFGSDDVDLGLLDLESLLLLPSGVAPVRILGKQGAGTNLDRDGNGDLLLTFDRLALGLPPGPSEICLSGLIGDRHVEGCTTLTTCHSGSGANQCQ